MIGEKEIWENLTLIQLLTGLPVEQFLELFSQIEAVYEEYERVRHSKPNRKRAVGGGRKCDTPLVVRVAMVLMYIRLYTT
ncbi:MAG: IS5/IS1182 family transposase, partial [Halobacteriota archaeon]